MSIRLDRRGLLIALSLIGLWSVLPAPSTAQAVKQVKLTEQQVQTFLAAQKEIAAYLKTIPEPAPNAQPDPKVQAQIEALAKKNGFASYNDFDDVSASISFVMSGIDSQTGEYVGAEKLIQADIDAIKKDASMPAADKKRALDELAEARKQIQKPLPENIPIVKKYFKQLEAVQN